MFVSVSGPSRTPLHYRSRERASAPSCARPRACRHLTTAGGHNPLIAPWRHPTSPRLDTRLRSVMADDGAAVFDVQAVGGGFPRDYRRLTQLYCMNGGHHLQILPDGTVQGLRDDGDAHSKTSDTAHFYIQGRPAMWCVHVLPETAGASDWKITRSLPVGHWRCVGREGVRLVWRKIIVDRKNDTAALFSERMWSTLITESIKMHFHITGTLRFVIF